MRRNARTHKQGGFTLVELMLAMGFFSAILIASTVVIIQVFSVYNKGLAVQQINALGRRLTDDTIRVGNSAVGNVNVGPGSTPRCLVIGSTVYLWSYANDTAASSDVYKVSAPFEVMPFSRYSGGVSCPSATTVIPRSDIEPLLGSNVRVYNTKIEQIGGAGTNDLLRFRLVLGTYGGAGSPDNPTVTGDTVSCQGGDLGNFCAFGSYDTVIYLPNS